LRDSEFYSGGATPAGQIEIDLRAAAAESSLFRGIYNRYSPWAVADFDATQFFARFQIDN
jgi:hypothetical protein